MASMKGRIAAFSLAALISSQPLAYWKPKEPTSYQLSHDGKRYTAQLMNDSENPFKKSWSIQSGTLIVGDEHHEADEYKKLAFTAAIARHVQSSPGLRNDLLAQQTSLENLLRVNNAVNMASTIVTYGSQAAGMLTPALATMNPATSSASQMKTIQTIAKTAALKVTGDIAEEIYVNDQNIDDVEAAKKALKLAEKRCLAEIAIASKKLEKSRNILSNHVGPWSYQQAEEFYTNWKTGLVYGLAYADVLADINQPNLDKQISINYAKGLGIPQKLIELPKKNRDFLTRPFLKDVEGKIQRHIVERERIFDPLDDLYTNIEQPLKQPLNPGQSRIVDYRGNSRANDLVSIGWRLKPNNCYDVSLENRGIESYKSLEILIDDVITPAGAKRSEQRIDLDVISQENSSGESGQITPGESKTIENAVCIQPSDASQGIYMIKYSFRYKTMNEDPKKSGQFIRSIKVK